MSGAIPRSILLVSRIPVVMHRSHSSRSFARLLPALLFATLSCSDGSGPAPVPAALAIVGGDNQPAVVGDTVPQPLVVRVTDANGSAIRRVVVRFAIVAGGGQVTSSLDTTDAAGEASTRWVAGTALADSQVVEAAIESPGTATTVAPVRFRAQPVAGTAATLVAAESVVVFRTVEPLVARRVRVLDRHGNGVPNVDVQFAVAEGGGTLTATSARTDADGWAESGFWTPDATADTSRLVASVPGTPATLTLMARRPYPLRVTAVAVGDLRACAITTDGETWCWGSIPMRSSTVRFVSLAAGPGHSCGLEASGAAWCWGSNLYGALGDGTTVERLEPTAVQTSVRFKSLSVGQDHTCGIATDDRAWCWGLNFHGEVGDGATGGDADRLVPTAVAGDLRYRSMASGHRSNCGVTVDDALWCWGSGRFYEIPIDSTAQQCGTWTCYPTPRLIAASGVADVDMGYLYGCMRAPDGTLSCWGNYIPGMGLPAQKYEAVPALSGFAFERLAFNNGSICGLANGGRAYCNGVAERTGTDSTGQGEIAQPAPVSGGRVYSAIDSGFLSSMTCAIEASTAKLYCWGFGEFGDGNPAHTALTPVVVREP